MATKTILDSTLTAIANAIRAKTGDSGTMTPLEMPEEIENIPTGGGGDTLDEVLLSKTSTAYTNNTFSGEIPQYAFYNIQSLQEVEMTHATSIGNGAFYGCSGLTSVKFPLVTSIGGTVFQNAFSSANGGADVSFPELTSIGMNAFNSSKIKSINLPKISTVLASGFQNCTSLKSVTFPIDITLAGNALRGCSALESVTFGGDVNGIAANTFNGCTACTLYDFSHCTAVPALDNTNAFSNINANAKIVVPDSLYSTWIAATNWTTYASYIVKASEA